MDVVAGKEHAEDTGRGDGGREASSSTSPRSSLSPLSGFNSPDGLGAPEEYCKQVRSFTHVIAYMYSALAYTKCM